MTIRHSFAAFIAFSLIGVVSHLCADDRRSPPPDFSGTDTSGTFFPSLGDAIKGERPRVTAMRKAANAAAAAVVAQANDSGGSSAGAGGGKGKWDGLISASSIEDEIKRVKLHFDGVVTTPGAFKSGGYQDARLDLSVLAVMFAVINEYGAEVRWKDQAAAARDLLARSAFNCKAGSTQVYNEAKLRKADLQDLVSGGGLANKAGEKKNEWTMIVDRTPLMQYLEELKDSLQQTTNDQGKIKAESDKVKREAELFALIGVVLTQEGMDDFDDDEYKALSKTMTDAGRKMVSALENNQLNEVRKSMGMITQSCDACHENYR